MKSIVILQLFLVLWGCKVRSNSLPLSWHLIDKITRQILEATKLKLKQTHENQACFVFTVGLAKWENHSEQPVILQKLHSVAFVKNHGSSIRYNP